MSEPTQSLLLDRPRLGALTFLRFLAACWVMTFHMHCVGAFSWGPAWLQGIISRAAVAVTFFFLLSGFILVYTYAGREIDLKRFWNARLARIYPVYLLSLLLTAPGFFWTATHANSFPGAAWFGQHLGLTTALVLTMQQSWVPLAAIAWNAVCWAISVEVFFYILFPLLLKHMSRWSLTQLATLAVLSWLAAVSLAGLYVKFSPDGLQMSPWNMPDGHFWLHLLKFNPLVRLPEFIAGMACGLWFLRIGHESRRATALIAGGSALLLAILVLGRHIPYPILHTGLAAPAFAAIICGFALRPSWSDFLDRKFFRLLGESSFSLFMLHGIVVYIPLFAGGDSATHTMPTPTALRCLIGVTLGIALGLAVFRWVEEPLRKKLRFGSAKG